MYLPYNYRPVSCLSVPSKVLEKIVCDQITDYMEKNKLLPQNQHGFRAGRSTMSALSAVQQQWAENKSDEKITGVMLWDLSAAFDTLDAGIFSDKLNSYGFDTKSCKWFMSFLSGRSQQVNIWKNIINQNNVTDWSAPKRHIVSNNFCDLWGRFGTMAQALIRTYIC